MNSTGLDNNVGSNKTFFNLNLKNNTSSSKEFMINYSFQNIPFGKQSLNKHKNLNDNTTNYNLSLGLNSLDSNLTKFSFNSNYLSLFDNYNLKKTN
jgi:hypothetical protein